ncbi:TPA: hypothetical protein HA361_04440 [Candidatus Woesearchaeota archaeon]|nr:hypothetical protein [Candidatus Woesearchaeota archaeon]HII69013.1 hypothetical protein [Candidatus Woesearchaeota archaeon]
MELVSIILIGIIILACLVLGMAIIRLAPEEQEPGRDYFLAVEDLCFIAASLAALFVLSLSGNLIVLLCSGMLVLYLLAVRSAVIRYFLLALALGLSVGQREAFIALALSSALFSVAHGSLIANRHSFLASLKRIPAYAAFPVIAALPLLFSYL